MPQWVKIILYYLSAVLLQVLLLNNLHLWGLCYPCVYLFALCCLPVNIPRWIELFIGFFTGLLIDMSCNTLGCHCAACVAFAYARPLLIANLVQDKERLIGSFGSEVIGIGQYAKIVAVAVSIHHVILFVLLSWSPVRWWLTIVQIVLSIAATLLILLVIELFRHR